MIASKNWSLIAISIPLQQRIACAPPASGTAPREDILWGERLLHDVLAWCCKLGRGGLD